MTGFVRWLLGAQKGQKLALAHGQLTSLDVRLLQENIVTFVITEIIAVEVSLHTQKTQNAQAVMLAYSELYNHTHARTQARTHTHTHARTHVHTHIHNTHITLTNTDTSYHTSRTHTHSHIHASTYTSTTAHTRTHVHNTHCYTKNYTHTHTHTPVSYTHLTLPTRSLV